MECPSCGFQSPFGMNFCGMCGIRLAQLCPACGFSNPPEFRFCGSCGRPLIEGAVRGEREHKYLQAAFWSLDTPDLPLEAAPSMPKVSALEPVRVTESRTAPTNKNITARDVHLEGERRVATVILADVTDSTDLMEKMGTEAWVSMMNYVFYILESEIYRYGGTVDQFRGDGLVAFFGTDAVHEDDPERAVLASLAMQKRVSAYADELREQQGINLRLRIGVNTGEVIVANVGDRSRYSEDTAMGEAIALAARMETAAEPGTVLVSENTYHLAASYFEWRALGEITVKGISQPVTVYCPLMPRADVLRSLRLETMGLRPVMVGREEQFESLRQRTQKVCEGEGGVVLLFGDEGMGKSYLVSEVRQQILRDEALLASAAPERTAPCSPVWLWGHCRSYEQSWPYSMWLDLLRRWLGGADEPREETRRRLREETEALWGSRAQEYYPYLAALLALPLEEEFLGWVEGPDAESLRQRSFFAVRAWVEALAEHGPLILVFEDVHWVDATSFELLEYCLPLCQHKPLVCLIMARLDRNSPIWDLYHRITSQHPQQALTLTLAPLDEVQAGEMIDRLIGPRALPARTQSQVIKRAEGNPYYIEEILRSLIKEGVLVQSVESGEWHAIRTVDSLDLPNALRSLLLARMEDLAPDERRVLQLAAVVGMIFWTSVLRELLGEGGELEQHLAALQRAQFIQEHGRVPYLDMEYRFRSALIRDLAYDSVLNAQKEIYSRQVADYLARLFGEEVLTQYYGVVAYQYRHAREPRKELFYTLSAAEHAQSIYANTEALDYYTRALELLNELEQEETEGPWQDWRLESLKGLGQIYFGIGQGIQAEPYLREAIALGEEMALATRDLVRLYYWLGEVLFWQRRYKEQVEIAERGLALLGQDTRSVETALMNQEIAVGYQGLHNREKFLEFTERTAQFLDQLPYSEELRPAYDHVASMYAFDRKDLQEALRWVQALEERATAHRDLRALGQAHDYGGVILMETGDLAGAQIRYTQALDWFERVGDATHIADSLSHLADVSLLAGDIESAQQYISRLLDKENADEVETPVWTDWRYGRLLAIQQRWDEAIETLERSRQVFQASGDIFRSALSGYYLGLVYLLRQDRETARRLLEEAAGLIGLEVVAQDPLSLVYFLHAMESAVSDADAFRVLCDEWRRQLSETMLVEWFLNPVICDWTKSEPDIQDLFLESLSTDWTWLDPFDDCLLRVQDGLQIQAANGRDLWYVNQSAPRIVREIEGDWAVETICAPASDKKPMLGGVLVWKDKEHYLRLDRGMAGPQSLAFVGCLENKDVVIGRGILAAAEEHMFLRLERKGPSVRALCSLDGETWFSVGEAVLAASEPLMVGLYGRGQIERMVYPGAHRQGAAIQFRSFRLWRMPATAL